MFAEGLIYSIRFNMPVYLNIQGLEKYRDSTKRYNMFTKKTPQDGKNSPE